MSGLGNIYYVGRTTALPPYIREPLFSAYRGRKHLQPASPRNQSRSTSCPKTQRSRYMKSIDQMRTMTPSYRHNEMMTRKAMLVTANKQVNREKQNEERQPVKISRQEERGKNTSKQSSAFRPVLLRKDVVKEAEGGPAPKVVRFRKVQQPTKQKHVHWKTQHQFKLHSLPLVPGRPLLRPSLPLQQPIHPLHPHRIDSNLQLSHSCSQQQPVLSQYKLQPLKKLFLCGRCYQFTPMIELRSHHLNCKIPLRKEEFGLKWSKLIALLEECYREEENNVLYRLTDRMKGYLREEGEHSRREGYILYSQQLACILSLKGNVGVDCVREEDLFWLIQTLGDLIETKSQEIDETAFWKICT